MVRKQTDINAINEKIVRSGQEFSAALEHMIDATQKDIDRECRREFLNLYAELVRSAPKDTGYAAANFFIDQQPVEDTEPRSEYPPIKREKGRRNRRADDPEVQRRLAPRIQKNTEALGAIPHLHAMHMTNNTEYLPYLEDGHSQKQAPTGFIANTLQMWARNFERIAAAYNARKG